MDDSFFMKKVLSLAKKGSGRVSPNPRVGALVVKGERILARGYHGYFGGPHAEINALSKLELGKSLGSTLYVNLEPCCHYGKRPPCTDSIIKSKVGRVVVGVLDPNPIVRGKGIQKLREAGIEVSVGVLEEECFELNGPYFKYVTQKKPFITLKIAQTLDGKISTSKGHSRWITGEASRRLVHRMRKESDALLVGVNTVIADDPELTVRMVRGNRVRRVILDSRLRIPSEARVLKHSDSQNTIIATTSKAPPDKIRSLQKMGITLWVIEENDDGRVDFTSLWKKMTDEGIISVFVEGGKQVFTSLLCTNQVDRIIVFIAPKLFGHGISAFGELGIDTPDSAISLQKVRWYRKGQDMVVEGRL